MWIFDHAVIDLQKSYFEKLKKIDFWSSIKSMIDL